MELFGLDSKNWTKGASLAAPGIRLGQMYGTNSEFFLLEDCHIAWRRQPDRGVYAPGIRKWTPDFRMFAAELPVALPACVQQQVYAPASTCRIS
jgi:hypothetical protein